ncbi:ATP-binding protein [Shewanella atlantica]|uniref:histidine kinase n=1 Tax=Shewanella atlantica TaxID=271099 RepID=A0A3S0L5R7_9GAMM|nr:ATP-binding protein [Shewanella atlantica]RTR27678.1 two-component sensor histidine kinase [Shewanella atlantica]
MKRLFLLSYGTILITFFIAMIAMDQLELFSTDELEDIAFGNEISATAGLLTEIAELKGQAQAERSFKRFADKMHLTLETYEESSSEISKEIKAHLSDRNFFIEDAEEDIAYLVFGDKQKIYLIADDMSSPFMQQMRNKEWLILVEICTSLAIITFIVLFFLARRLRRLENTYIAFADGDFTARASTKMFHNVGKLNNTFNIMADRISQLISSNRNLTNAVAHEFRTPIFRIQCNLDMLDDSKVRPDQMPHLEGIQSDLNELNSMVEELLHFSKLERLDTSLPLEPTDIGHLLEKQLNHLQFETEAKLTLHVTDNCIAPVSVRALQRALGNVIRNGYKYANSEVRISLQASPEELHIAIENDGPDIPIKDRETIFDPFVRLDKSRDRQSGGHGLGLAITKQIIKQHKGRIYISDSKMGGACFNIKLPL